MRFGFEGVPIVQHRRRKSQEVKGLYGNSYRLALCKECSEGRHRVRKSEKKWTLFST